MGLIHIAFQICNIHLCYFVVNEYRVLWLSGEKWIDMHINLKCITYTVNMPKNVVSNNITQAMSTDLLGERSRRHCPIHISKWQGVGLVFPHKPSFMELKCVHYYFWRAQHTVDLLVLEGIWNSRIYFLSTWLRSKIVTSPQYVHSNT